MPKPLDIAAFDAARQQVAAAVATRDHQALLAGARALAATAQPPRGRRWLTGFMDSHVGAALLTGLGDEWAESLRRHLVTDDRDGKPVPVINYADEPPSLHVELALLEIRLLAREWKLPAPASGYVHPDVRAMLRRHRDLIGALERRDPRAAGSAIAAFGRVSPLQPGSSWSLLAYALYQEARKIGIAVNVPKQYDF